MRRARHARDDRRMSGAVTPRAIGRRQDYAVLPREVRAWIDLALGSDVVSAETQRGGFSTGVAARVVTREGGRAFVKAVSDEINVQTPELFRHEISVLQALAEVPYRASLRDSYDDGTWVVLLLDDVDGRHPDLHDARDVEAVRRALVDQARELTPDPVALDVIDMESTANRWASRVKDAVERRPDFFPLWFIDGYDVLGDRLASLGSRMPAESWTHLDIRDDNLLVRHDGTAVIVDWGMSRSGPSWLDQVLLAVHRVDDPAFDEQVVSVATFGASSDRGRALQDDITDLVLALGTSLAALRDRPVEGIPEIDAFRRTESARLLEGARRRLGA